MFFIVKNYLIRNNNVMRRLLQISYHVHDINLINTVVYFIKYLSSKEKVTFP